MKLRFVKPSLFTPNQLTQCLFRVLFCEITKVLFEFDSQMETQLSDIFGFWTDGQADQYLKSLGWKEIRLTVYSAIDYLMVCR